MLFLTWTIIILASFVLCHTIFFQVGRAVERKHRKAIRAKSPSESLIDGIDLGHYKPLVDDLLRNIAELTKAGFTQNDEQISSRHAAIREIIRKRKEEIRQQALEGRNDLVQAQLLGIEIKPKEVTPPNFRPAFTDDIHVDERIVPIRKYTSKELDKYDPIPAYARKSLENRRIAENAKREKERLQKKIKDDRLAKAADWEDGERVISQYLEPEGMIRFVKTQKKDGFIIQRAIPEQMWIEVQENLDYKMVYRSPKRYSLADDPCSCGVDNCDGF